MEQATVTERPEPRVTLGDLIKRTRRDKGWDQAQLAEAIGVSRQAVSAWERDRSEPDFSIVRRIVAVTGAEWLYTEPFRDELRTRSRWCDEPAVQNLAVA